MIELFKRLLEVVVESPSRLRSWAMRVSKNRAVAGHPCDLPDITHRQRDQLAEEYANGYLTGWSECFDACMIALEEELREVEVRSWADLVTEGCAQPKVPPQLHHLRSTKAN
ncbi:MAG: hypothetical protein ACRD50_16560 [Candidatus Acidiferrales bacterium]